MVFRGVLVSFGVFIGGCAGGGLEKADVTSLPPGDAVGAAASGTYDLDLVVKECKGSCGPIDAGIFTVSLCDVGDVDHAEAIVTQTDGALVLESEGLVVEHLEGGIDANGAFVIGGYGTDQGGDVELFVLGTGTLAGDLFQGGAESRGRGAIDGESFDCTAIYDVSGARVP